MADPDPGQSGRGPGDTFDVIDFAAKYAAPLFLLALLVVFALLEPRFLPPLNLFNILRQVSISGLVAIGMTFVILTAGIDLSVGSLLALCGLVGAYVAKGGLADRFAVGASVEDGGFLGDGIENDVGIHAHVAPRGVEDLQTFEKDGLRIPCPLPGLNECIGVEFKLRCDGAERFLVEASLEEEVYLVFGDTGLP